MSRVPVYDVAWGALSPLLAFFLRDGTIYSPSVVAAYCAAALLASLLVFQWFQTGSPIVRFYSVHDALELLKACALVAALSAVTLFLVSRLEDAPRAIPILHFLLLGTGLLATRALIARRETWRDRPFAQPNKATRHILIIQASRLAWFFCRMVEELAPGDFQIVAILDERTTMRHRSLHGYLCVHGAYHHWSRLKWLADLNAMLATTAADVTRLHRHAQSIGAGLCAGQALLLCRDLFDLALPIGIAAELKVDRRVSYLANIALRAMTKPLVANKPMHAVSAGIYGQFLFGRGWRFFAAQCRATSVGVLEVCTGSIQCCGRRCGCGGGQLRGSGDNGGLRPSIRRLTACKLAPAACSPTSGGSNRHAALLLVALQMRTKSEQCAVSLIAETRQVMKPDKKSAWLRKLDAECPYQVVLPRQQLMDDSAILDFLIKYVGVFDMYVEDDYAAFVRYCFADPMDAEVFRARFEPKDERFKLAG